MNKIKRIERIIKEHKLTIKGDKLEITKRLKVTDYYKFMLGIVGYLFVKDEQDDIEYRPYLYDMVFKYSIIQYFTNIDFDNIDLEKANEIFDNTNLIDLIVEIVGYDYVDKMIIELDELIDFKKQKCFSENKVIKAVNSFAGILDMIKDQIADIDVEQLEKNILEDVRKENNET